MSSSDLSVFHGSSLHRPLWNLNTASSDSGLHLHYSDCLNPFPDSPIDILQAVSEESNQQTSHLDPNAPTLFPSSSPPLEQLQNLSLAHLQNLPNCSDSLNGFADFSGFDDVSPGFELVFDGENAANMMQRSFSGDFFDGGSGFFLQSLLEPDLLDGQMRRTCSAGDLQNAMDTSRRHLASSEVVPEGGSFMEEAASFRVGRYSAEERRERIHRYRAKRHQRNFNKTIKYACRKTLAENRPRIRGRFARTDAPAGTTKFACSSGYDGEDEIWIHGMHEEEGDD